MCKILKEMEAIAVTIQRDLPRMPEGYSFGEYGWGNGYVDLPKGHCLFGKEVGDLNVDVHGGITYTNLQADGKWRIGFDTAHSSDSLDKWPEKAVMKETLRLKKQVDKIHSKSKIGKLQMLAFNKETI